jgi:hypothetical protein
LPETTLASSSRLFQSWKWVTQVPCFGTDGHSAQRSAGELTITGERTLIDQLLKLFPADAPLQRA